MAVDLREFHELKAEVDRCQREADRAEGALEQLMAKLKSEYGVTTVDEAKQLQQRLMAQAARDSQAYDTALAAFKEDWGHALE